jgi:Heparinase II/III-like protein/Heparinase II/III N-terminus
MNCFVPLSLRLKLQTYLRLGLMNVLIVALYRVAVKIGLFKLQKVQKLQGPYFSEQAATDNTPMIVRYFSYHEKVVASPPDWFVNPFNEKRFDTLSHWTDDMPELGDIKTVWELSRFDWLPKLAWQVRQGDKTALPRLEQWLRDWTEHNPPYQGINWKCGQETSLRCLNMLVASFVLQKQPAPLPGFLNFLETHLERVAPTIYYAVAQDNNHGTSEGAALFIVGSYLARVGSPAQRRKGARWARAGRYWLENRVKHLILEDGSFSQHSLVYHRFMLDTLSLVELFRRHDGLELFSTTFYERLKAASQWLFAMVDAETGDVPNLGHNDGSYLFNLTEQPYRDFRPSVNLAMLLFCQKNVYASARHPLVDVFQIRSDNLLSLELESHLFAKGGYARLQSDVGAAFMRLPRYVFRPAHADALHVDVWHRGRNILCDGGSYSYNTAPEKLTYYGGTESHNTIRFDGHDQMPRLGRYLFAAWLKPSVLEFTPTQLRAGYQDHWRTTHTRTLFVEQDGWRIVDECANFTNAELSWRLGPGDWTLQGNVLENRDIRLEVSGDGLSLELSQAAESRYYLAESLIPVLKVRFLATTTTLVTTITLTGYKN